MWNWEQPDIELGQAFNTTETLKMRHFPRLQYVMRMSWHASTHFWAKLQTKNVTKVKPYIDNFVLQEQTFIFSANTEQCLDEMNAYFTFPLKVFVRKPPGI